MPTEIPGINLLVIEDGTALVAQSDATLTSSPELAEAIVKSTNFTQQLSGDQEWSVSFGGQITDSSSKHALSNGNAGLLVGDESDITGVDTTNSIFTLDEDRSSDWAADDTVRVINSTGNDQEYTIASISGTDVTVDETISDSTADGAMFKPVNVPGIQTLTVTLEQELNEVPPGVDEATGWKSYVPLRRSWSVELEGHYYEPDDTAVYKTIHDARDNGNNLGAELNIMSGIFAGEIAADGMDISAGTDNSASYSLTWQGSGGVNKGGTFESTIDSVIDLYVNQNSSTVALERRTDGSVVTGSTKWDGTAHISSIEMGLERNAFPTLDAEFQGDGSLTRTTQ